MPKYRLKSDHSLVKRFEELREHADRLGISLSFIGDQCMLADASDPTKWYRVEDLDSSEGVTEFPYTFEVKLTYEA